MPQTIRKYWSPRKGRHVMNFNWEAINFGSVVSVTACEYVPVSSGVHIVNSDQPKHVGDANVWVSGVAPHSNPGGVTFAVNVDWPDPLPIVTDITLFDDLPFEIQDP